MNIGYRNICIAWEQSSLRRQDVKSVDDHPSQTDLVTNLGAVQIKK